jgi:four helix bundle protein
MANSEQPEKTVPITRSLLFAVHAHTMSQSYRDLKIWQEAIELSVQISADIAEGWGRGTQPQFANFIRISRGSLCEVESHAELAHRLNFLSKEDHERLNERCTALGAMLFAFLRKIEVSYVKENGKGYMEIAE